MSDPINEALVLYTGFGNSPFPRAKTPHLVQRFGEVEGTELKQRILGLLEELQQDAHADAVDWARVDAFRPYGGIRIEDDVACTDGDPLNLTREGFAEA